MLTIRLARTGKKKQAYYRLVVSDKRKTPTAKFIAIVGNYDPHAKKLTVDAEKLSNYLKNGVQPSDAVAKLLKKEKIELPKWVKITEKKKAPKKEAETKEAPKAEKSEPAPEAEAAEGDNNNAESAPAENVEAGKEEAPPARPKSETDAGGKADEAGEPAAE